LVSKDAPCLDRHFDSIEALVWPRLDLLLKQHADRFVLVCDVDYCLFFFVPLVLVLVFLFLWFWFCFMLMSFFFSFALKTENFNGFSHVTHHVSVRQFEVRRTKTSPPLVTRTHFIIRRYGDLSGAMRKLAFNRGFTPLEQALARLRQDGELLFFCFAWQ
jgi:hypothetical protein